MRGFKRRLLFRRLVVMVSWLLWFGLQVFPVPQVGQGKHFYNVDKEITLKGKIIEIKMEACYPGQPKFLILYIEEEKTGRKFIVEVSPTWFFERNFHQGEPVELKGSLVKESDEGSYVIAREMRCQGELFILRDKHGFPTWRGGRQHRMGRRKKGH